MNTRLLATTSFLALLLGTSAASDAADPDSSGTRTLSAITIEGAVDVPQVLFITSQETARYDDGQAAWYLDRLLSATHGQPWPIALRPYSIRPIVTAADTSVTASPAPPEAKE